MEYDDQNREIPDQTPVAMPIGYEKPESLTSMIKRMVRNEEFLRKADEEGFDTDEEADDFDVDDPQDVHFTSDHEFTEMVEEIPEETPAPQQAGSLSEDDLKRQSAEIKQAVDAQEKTPEKQPVN